VSPTPAVVPEEIRSRPKEPPAPAAPEPTTAKPSATQEETRPLTESRFEHDFTTVPARAEAGGPPTPRTRGQELLDAVARIDAIARESKSAGTGAASADTVAQLLQATSTVDITDRQTLGALARAVADRFPPEVVVPFLTAIERRLADPRELQRRGAWGLRGPGVLFPALLQAVPTGVDVERLENAFRSGGAFFEGVYAGFSEKFGPEQFAQLATRLQYSTAITAVFPPLFMTGAAVGIVEEAWESVVGLAKLAVSLPEVLEAVDELLDVVFSPQGEELARVMGHELGAEYAAKGLELLEQNLVEFTFNIGRRLGPMIASIVLAVVAPEASIPALAARLGARLKPLLLRLPLIAKLARRFGAVVPDAPLLRAAERLPRAKAGPPLAPAPVPTPEPPAAKLAPKPKPKPKPKLKPKPAVSRARQLIGELEDTYEDEFASDPKLLARLDEITELAKDPANEAEALARAQRLERDLRRSKGTRAEMAREQLRGRREPEGEVAETTKRRTRRMTPEAILADALESAGDPRPSDFHAAHHIVPKRAMGGTVVDDIPSAERARQILEAEGIGINDARNGVWLASETEGVVAESFTRHPNVHTKRYYDELAVRLEKALEHDDVAGELARIKVLIANGDFPH
jgi:A nuclease family of the HNH/ENDO VII superfamily with conserved AHH